MPDDNLEPIPAPVASGMTDRPFPASDAAVAEAQAKGFQVTPPPQQVAMPAPDNVIAAPAAAPPPQTPQQAAQQQYAQADAAHHYGLGKAVKALFGQPTTSYQVNPQTGEMRATQTPQKPGQMFRNLLAGAILGGAVGTEDMSPGFGRSFFRAGAAGINRAEQQDQQRRQQAIEDAKRQQEAQKFQTEQDLNKQHIALLNQQTIEAAYGSMGKSIAFHDEVVNNGTGAIAKEAYAHLGVPPTYSGISETEMVGGPKGPQPGQNFLKAHPDALNLHWIVTGRTLGPPDPKTGVAPVQYTFSAYKPPDKVTVTPAMTEAYKGDADAYAALKAKQGQDISFGEFSALLTQAHELHKANLPYRQKELAQEKEEADIKRINAETDRLVEEKKKIAEDRKIGGEARTKAQQDQRNLTDANFANQHTKYDTESGRWVYDDTGLSPEEKARLENGKTYAGPLFQSTIEETRKAAETLWRDAPTDEMGHKEISPEMVDVQKQLQSLMKRHLDLTVPVAVQQRTPPPAGNLTTVTLPNGAQGRVNLGDPATVKRMTDIVDPNQTLVFNPDGNSIETIPTSELDAWKKENPNMQILGPGTKAGPSRRLQAPMSEQPTIESVVP